MAITYPVPADSRWAVYSVAQAQVLLRDQPWPRRDGGEIVGADPNLVMLRHVDPSVPEYDPALYTAAQEEERIDTNANTVTRSWVLTAIPLAEVNRATWSAQAKARKDREAKAALALPDSDDPVILRRKLNAALHLIQR